jgi:DNA mismatch endonuclease (patch repair protein)
MRANRRRDTSQEVALRSALHCKGWRFRVDHPIRVEGHIYRPDLVFGRLRVAVYCDGCYWHACPTHRTQPQANAAYWAKKLDENVERDRRANAALSAAGWRVVRLWEHVANDEAVAMVEGALLEERTRLGP